MLRFEGETTEGRKPKKWWDEVKRLSGVKVKSGDLIRQMNIEHFSDLFMQEQTNRIKSAFLVVVVCLFSNLVGSAKLQPDKIYKKQQYTCIQLCNEKKNN